jgi:hypothetical protein
MLCEGSSLIKKYSKKKTSKLVPIKKEEILKNYNFHLNKNKQTRRKKK